MWMATGGFLVPTHILNVFWRYVFHYIDYQVWLQRLRVLRLLQGLLLTATKAYVFQGMMVNEFATRTYNCDAECHCIYSTSLESQCKIDGNGVLAAYGYRSGRDGKWIGILLGIILVYRILGWAALWVRKA